MPAPVRDIIVTSATTPYEVSLEPAFNAVHSLVSLTKTDRLSGMGEWVTKTAKAMSAAEQRRHRLVMIGFYFAIMPDRSWPSFSGYVDHLERLQPMALRDKLLDNYIHLPCLDEVERTPLEKAAILASADSFLDFLGRHFSPEHIDAELERQAYSYIVDPPSMQSLIVSHLRHMWDAYLAAEWKRVEPMLSDAVFAFGQVNFKGMSRPEVIQFVTGQTFDENQWKKFLGKSKRLVFVPSVHTGPYLGPFKYDDALGIVFGARLPEGTRFHAPDLSRAEILVRLAALADDTRLRILRLIAEEGELRSQEIMQQLSLSQSAASRHLKQLSATGYVTERRCEGAKCYDLNQERVEGTMAAVSAFLSGL
jgi:ArsR family transcriptional regulator